MSRFSRSTFALISASSLTLFFLSASRIWSSFITLCWRICSCLVTDSSCLRNVSSWALFCCSSWSPYLFTFYMNHYSRSITNIIIMFSENNQCNVTTHRLRASSSSYNAFCWLSFDSSCNIFLLSSAAKRRESIFDCSVAAWNSAILAS